MFSIITKELFEPIVVSSNVVTQPKGTGNPVIQRDLRWRLEINDEDRSEFIKLQNTEYENDLFINKNTKLATKDVYAGPTSV